MATVALEQGAKMRIFVVLAISLSFGLPALAQNALWGTSGNNAGNNASVNGSGGPNYLQPNSGSTSTSGGKTGGNGTRRHLTKAQQAQRDADRARSKMSGASSVQGYDEKPVQSGQPAQSAQSGGNAQQAPAGAAPAQAEPTPHKQSGVQTY
jgi:hypothetical protein